MPSLSIGLKHLFPDADFVDQIVVVNDGDGERIAAWNYPAPQPSVEEIEAAVLPALRQQQIDAVTQERVRRNNSFFVFRGKRIAVDRTSKDDIAGAHGDWLTGTPTENWPGGWKTMDNEYVPIPDQATWMEFYRAMTSRGTANFMHAQMLKAQISASDDPLSIDVTAGWPE